MIIETLLTNTAVALPVPANKTKVVIYCDSGFGGAHVDPEIRVGYVPTNGGFTSVHVKPTWEAPAVVDLKGSKKVTLGRIDKGTAAFTVDFS